MINRTDKRIVVYLDLNHIIALAKQVKSGDNSTVNELESLFNSGKVIFPISAAHLMEIQAISNSDQRQDLANIIMRISHTYVLRPLNEVMYLEVAIRVAEHYQRTLKTDTSVITTGYLKALGEFGIDNPPRNEIDNFRLLLTKEAMDIILNDNILIKYLVASYFPKITTGSKEHLDFIAAIEKDRKLNASKSVEQMKEEVVLGLGHDFIKLVLLSAVNHNISEAEMFAKPPIHFWTKEYLATIPTIDTWTELNVYLYKNPSAPVKVNHIYDFGHLAVAIPYTDIVVTDHEMEYAVNFLKLGAKYHTNVVSNLNYAISILRG